MQTIKDFLYQTGKNLGIDTFLKSIGPWGTLFLAIVIGLASLVIVVMLIKLCTSIDNDAIKIVLILAISAVAVFLFYVYIDGCIAVINKLGGLKA